MLILYQRGIVPARYSNVIPPSIVVIVAVLSSVAYSKLTAAVGLNVLPDERNSIKETHDEEEEEDMFRYPVDHYYDIDGGSHFHCEIGMGGC